MDGRGMYPPRAIKGWDLIDFYYSRDASSTSSGRVSADDRTCGLWPVGGWVDADPPFVGWFAGPLVPRIR